MPASIRMLASGVRTSMQFVAIRMRLRASGVLSFSHMTLGTTPKTEPPSIRHCPSLRQWSSKRPSFRGAVAITPLRGASWDSADGSRSRPPRPGPAGPREPRDPCDASVRGVLKLAGNGIPRKWADETSSCSRDGPLKAVIDEVDDRLQGRPGAEDLDDAHLFQLGGVVLRDDATAKNPVIGGVVRVEQFEDAGDQRHVRAAVQADADRVDVFLDRRLYHHFWGLPKAGVDHLDTGVSQRPRNHFDAAVVPVEPHFGGQDPPVLLLLAGSHCLVR